MKGFLFHKPGSGEVTDFPERHPGANEVLVKVHFCGICGTDMNIWRGTDKSAWEIIPGHEYSGEIVETGEGVTGFAAGDRVCIDPNIPCGVCEPCRKGRINLCEHLTALGVDIDGGFAEYCIVPESQLFVLPDSMSYEEGALIEPLACALNGINRIKIKAGDDVCILGGGPMGLLMIQLAKLTGAGRVILCELREGRRKLGKELGADMVTDDFAKAEELLGGKPDAVIECIGNPVTQKAALMMVKPGGQVQLFGDGDMTKEFSIPSMLFYEKELTVTGAALNPFTHSQAMKTAASGRVKLLPLVSGKISVDELPDTLERGYVENDIIILVSFE